MAQERHREAGIVSMIETVELCATVFYCARACGGYESK